MSIEQFLEIMNTRVTITNGHVLMFVTIICLFSIYSRLRLKSRNTRIYFNVRELAQEREILRQRANRARRLERQEEQRRAMQENFRLYDEVYADPNFQEILDEAMNEVYDFRKTDFNWRKEGF